MRGERGREKGKDRWEETEREDRGRREKEEREGGDRFSPLTARWILLYVSAKTKNIRAK